MFDISYLDGSSSQGDYFTDVFEMGGATLRNMTMGLGLKTDIEYGLVGVGYRLNEAIVGDTQSVSSAYPNLPVNMVQEGLINTVAYSLWLNDLGRSTLFLSSLISLKHKAYRGCRCKLWEYSLWRYRHGEVCG